MSLRIRTTEELRDTLKQKLGELKAAFQADIVTLHLYDPQRERLYFPVGVNLLRERRFMQGMPSMERVAGKIVRSHVPIVAEDAEHHPDLTGPFTHVERVKAAAGFPLVVPDSGEVMGVLFVDYRDVHRFVEDEIERIQAQVSELTGFINWNLQGDQGQMLRGALRRETDLRIEEERLQELIDRLWNILGDVDIALWTRERGKLDLCIKMHKGLDRDFVDHVSVNPNTDSSSVVSIAFVKRKEVLIEDPQADPGAIFNVDRPVTWQQILAMPVLSEYHRLGVLCAFRRERLGFTRRERDLVGAFANLIAVTIENEGRIIALNALHDVGVRLTLVTDLGEILQEVVRSACQVIGADVATVHLYDPVRQKFYDLEHAAVFPPEARPDTGKPRDKDGLGAQIVEHGRAYCEDVDTRADATAPSTFVRRQGIKAYVGTRLISIDEPLGVLYVNFKEKRRFSPEDLALVQILANYASTAIYNSRLYRQAKGRAEALARLHEVGRTLVSVQPLPGTLPEVLKRIVENARVVLDADLVDLYQYIQEREQFLLPPVSTGQRWDPSISIPKKIYDDDVVVQVIKEEKPRYFLRSQEASLLTGDFKIPREDKPDQRFVFREGVLSSAVIPLRAGDETAGVMFVNYRGPQTFPPEQREIIELFAHQAATAIYNTRSFQQTSEQAHALVKLSEVAQRLVSIQEAPESHRSLLEQIAESAKEVLNADIVELYEYLQDQEEYRLPQVSVGERRGPLVPKDKIHKDDVVFQLIQRKEPLYVERVRDEPIFTGIYTVERPDRPEERYVIREELESIAVIPLKAERETVGLMFANFRTHQAFTVEERTLVELFAHQAAVAIHNARLYDESLRKSKELQTVGKIAELLMSTLDVEKVPKLLMQQVVRLFGAEGASLWRADGTTGIIEHAFALDWEGEEEAFSKAIREMPLGSFCFGKGVLGTVAEAGMPMIVNEVEAEPRWNKSVDVFTGFTTKSILAVPLVHKREVVGVIEVVNRLDGNPFTVKDQELLTAIASSAAIALENARLYERKIREVKTLTELGQELAFSAMPVEGT